MRFSTDSENWTDWEAYKSTKENTLSSGDGVKKVYVAFKDKAGNISETYQQEITLDTTVPVIQFNGHQDTYSVDSSINITCSATDQLSGIALKDCPTVEGPAYRFKIGENKFTATAIDRAGNTAEATLQFTVEVDFDGVIRLTNQFVTKDGVAKSLEKKLQSAGQAAAKGNQKALEGKLKAYVNELKAQSGKAITGQHADTLISLADELASK